MFAKLIQAGVVDPLKVISGNCNSDGGSPDGDCNSNGGTPKGDCNSHGGSF